MDVRTPMHPQIVLQMPTKDMNKQRREKMIRNVEHGVFTPLVLSSNGGMGKEATTFFKRLADMKRNHHYSMVMGWLRCRLFFAVLMC